MKEKCKEVVNVLSKYLEDPQNYVKILLNGVTQGRSKLVEYNEEGYIEVTINSQRSLVIDENKTTPPIIENDKISMKYSTVDLVILLCREELGNVEEIVNVLNRIHRKRVKIYSPSNYSTGIDIEKVYSVSDGSRSRLHIFNIEDSKIQINFQFDDDVIYIKGEHIKSYKDEDDVVIIRLFADNDDNSETIITIS